MRKILFILLIIILASLTFSCTKKDNLYEKFSYGESFVEEKELIYSEDVIALQVKWVDVLIEIVGKDYFLDNGNQRLANTFQSLFLSSSISEIDACDFLQDLHTVISKINDIEKEKDALWQVYRNSQQLEPDKIKYKEDLALVEQKYWSKDIVDSYFYFVTIHTRQMGAVKFGNLLYSFMENILSIVSDPTKEIFIPDIYKILRKKSSSVTELKMAQASVGKDNFSTLIVAFSTIFSFTNEKETNYTDIFSIMKENDIKKVASFTAENLRKLSLTQKTWQDVTNILIANISLFDLPNEDVVPLKKDKILLYLGDNLHSLFLNSATVLETIDIASLPKLFQKAEVKDKNYYINGKEVDKNTYQLEKLKKDITIFKLINDKDCIDNYNNFWIELLENLESELLNLTLPDNYYENVTGKTFEEKETEINKVRDIDLSLVNYDTIEMYTAVLDNCNTVRLGYYKQNFPLAYYYITNTLGIRII